MHPWVCRVRPLTSSTKGFLTSAFETIRFRNSARVNARFGAFALAPEAREGWEGPCFCFLWRVDFLIWGEPVFGSRTRPQLLGGANPTDFWFVVRILARPWDFTDAVAQLFQNAASLFYLI